jgi:hypothetical protein
MIVPRRTLATRAVRARPTRKRRRLSRARERRGAVRSGFAPGLALVPTGFEAAGCGGPTQSPEPESLKVLADWPSPTKR